MTVHDALLTVLPRILFENWSNDDADELYNDVDARATLIETLVDLAEVRFQFIT